MRLFFHYALDLLPRDAQHLARVNFVRMAEHGPICFKNLIVAIGVAQGFLGNSRKRVAFFDLVKHGGSACVWYIILHFANARDVAYRQDDLFFDFLADSIAGYDNFAVRAHLDIQTGSIKGPNL